MISTDEKSKIADAWIRLQYAERDTAAHEENFWAHESLWELNRDNPRDCWDVILIILEKDSNDWILENLSAGPVEDLLVLHGNEFIEAVEERAKKEPIFRRMLRGVWRNEIPADVWRRLLEARE